MAGYLLQNAVLIVGTGQAPLSNTDILIEEGFIKRVAPAGEIKTADAEAVDLTGMTVAPGLINSHVHIAFEPVGDPFGLLLSEPRTRTVIRAAANLKKQLHSGVTYFRDMGGPDFMDIELRQCVKDGLIPGPEFLVSGKIITMTGGHGHQIGRECDGEKEVRKAAREQLKAGADVIKVMATGGVMTPGVEPGSPQLTLPEMAAAVEEAHNAGKKTAAHAQGATGIKNAILAGIDSIEHGIFLDDEAIELMIERDVYLVPTLVAPYFIVKHGIEGGVPEYAVEKSKRVLEIHRESFIKAKKAGVKIAMGTDAGTPFNQHNGAAYELQLMVDYGMTPLEAITAAAKTSAELLGIDDQYGVIEEGKAADLIILAENPIEKIKAYLDVKQVYKKGVPVTLTI